MSWPIALQMLELLVVCVGVVGVWRWQRRPRQVLVSPELVGVTNSLASSIASLHTAIQCLQVSVNTRQDDVPGPVVIAPPVMPDPPKVSVVDNEVLINLWEAERKKHKAGSPRYRAFTDRLRSLGVGD